MRKFTFIVMRPLRLLEQHTDFRTVQDLQYAATLRAKDRQSAARAAVKEAFEADREDFNGEPEFAPAIEEYIVLGHIEYGTGYTPWLNLTFP